MSDFSFETQVLRGQMANALSENPEQLAWVIGELANLCDPEEIAEFSDQVSDPVNTAVFLRGLADRLDPAGA